MTETPDGVLLYIPLIKEMGMSWKEIKETPRYELEGLLSAYHEYQTLHSMDGYDEKDIQDIAKNKPSIRKQWIEYTEKRRKYNVMMGLEQPQKSFKNLLQ